MSLPFDAEIVSAFVLEAQLTLAPIASSLKSRLRDESDLEPELAEELLRSTVAVEQAASYLELEGVSRLSCSVAALLSARRSGKLAAHADDLALLTRAFDRLHEAVSRPERRCDAGVAVEIEAIRARLTASVESETISR